MTRIYESHGYTVTGSDSDVSLANVLYYYTSNCKEKPTESYTFKILSKIFNTQYKKGVTPMAVAFLS